MNSRLLRKVTALTLLACTVTVMVGCASAPSSKEDLARVAKAEHLIQHLDRE